MGNGHTALFRRVFELNVTAFGVHLVPAVRLQYRNDIAALHVCINTHNYVKSQQLADCENKPFCPLTRVKTDRDKAWQPSALKWICYLEMVPLT